MKRFLTSLCAIVLMIAPTFQVNASEDIQEVGEAIVQVENNDEVAPISSRSLKNYTYTNSTTLSPVKVKFVAAIDVQKNSSGSYYMYSATYEKPTVINSGTSSFQVNSVSSKKIDGGRTYVVSATGTFVKDGNNMGTKTVSAYYYLNLNTGDITMSYV